MNPTTSIVALHDVASPSRSDAPINQSVLKTLTLLYDTVYFDIAREEDLEEADRWKSRPEEDRNSYLDQVITYRDLFAEPKVQARKTWRDLESIWQPLPEALNVQLNQNAFGAVSYGASSMLPGMLELDYFLATALHCVRYHSTGDDRFTTDQWHNGLHAAWIWCATGMGSTTTDPHLFQALELFVASGRKIDLTSASEKEKLEKVVEAVRQWNPSEEYLAGARNSESPVTTLQWLIPDFSLLGWEEILHLRRSALYGKFREWFFSNVLQKSLKQDIVAIPNLVNQALWDLAREATPKPKEALITAIAGGLPLGPIPINPIGVAAAARDVKRQYSLKERFGWLSWLAEARAKMAGSGSRRIDF